MPENTNIRNLGKMPDDNRIEGIDVARSIALIGMVYINLNVILGTNFEEVYVMSNLGVLNNALQGRFASLFLVIAGLGLGLFKQKYDKNYDIRIIKRAIFFFCRLYQFTILGTRYNSYVFNLFYDGNCFYKAQKRDFNGYNGHEFIGSVYFITKFKL